MEAVTKLALAGGLFAILTFIHFFVDWVFQSHSEAMVKHNNAKVRAKHCLIYTAGFIPFMWYLHFSLLGWIVCLNVLFWSHFYLDTYHLVYLWAKYIRRPPEMVDPIKVSRGPVLFITDDPFKSEIKEQFDVLPPNPKEGFIVFVQTPLGKILMITLDQISHLWFLWVLVIFAILK